MEFMAVYAWDRVEVLLEDQALAGMIATRQMYEWGGSKRGGNMVGGEG